MGKKIGLAVLMAAILLIAIFGITGSGLSAWLQRQIDRISGREEKYGVFSWKSDLLGEEEWGIFEQCQEQASVGELYQEFPKGFLQTQQAKDFLGEMSRQEIAVYNLVGEASWAYETEGDSLREVIEETAAFNSSQPKDKRIQGIMADVEPYLLEEWEEGENQRERLMAGYLSGISEAYQAAQSEGLSLLVCIPVFYDTSCQEILESLIRDGCDGVAVMNYNRRDEYGQIKNEVQLAKSYGKEIICVYELQEAGQHDLEEMNTYAEEGLEALRKSAESLRRSFEYGGLRFAYHYYEPLKDMLGMESPSA